MLSRTRERKTPNPIDVHVGRRIRMRRVWIEMTQETLAQALGISFQQVQKYEKGTNRVGASRLNQIAAALGVPPSFFFEEIPGRQEDAEKPNSNKELTDFLASEEGFALNRAFNRIKDMKVRRRFISLVETLAVQE
ncbi:helix-turn-helix transcriptional regulator [Ochrobactrum sp. 3-3]|uniref:helix-turn-helix domain-containing protein n=1 Tax=Ochrobactrum sp. 3-3 TaxID=1830124 RepID=UPI000DEF2B1A|nr:helix-turn-helix transcriptional regulator [Ochrobactrum sp. 3-3]